MTVWHQTIFKVILQLSECSVPFPRFNVYFSNERGFSLLVPMIKAGAGLGNDSHIADVHLANVHQALYSTFTISLTVNYDFAANFYDLAAKFLRLIFNEITVIL